MQSGHCIDDRYHLHMRGTRREIPEKLSRKHPTITGIIRAWRRLTTPRRAQRAGRGAPTLVACSGGADSCALLLSLVVAGEVRIVAGHVVHDLRPRAEAEADRDAVRRLAERLGVEYLEASVKVAAGYKGERNAEAAARRARYDALAEMASTAGVRFVATAHHAEDQLETVLMSLLRGTGAGGVRGLATRRRMGKGRSVLVIRPMASRECGVAIDRAACRAICEAAGVAWREDVTNADTTRLRAAVRHGVVPALRGVRWNVLERAVTAADQADEVARLLRREGRRLMQSAERTDGRVVWAREVLRAELPISVGAVLRMARRRLCGPRGEDQAGKRQVGAIVRAIRDRSTDPRRFPLGGACVVVAANGVTMTAGE